MKTSSELKALAPALAKAQAQILTAKRESTNPHFRSDYADLKSVWDSCRDALTANGFSVPQTVFTGPESKPYLNTMLLHSSGEFISGEVQIPITKAGPQELGSCIKYMRRYALAALVGVIDGRDDDAEAAEGREQLPKSNYEKAKWPQDDAKTATPNRDIKNPPNAPLNTRAAQIEASSPGVRPNLLTQPQVKRLYAIAKSSGWAAPDVQKLIKADYNSTPEGLSRKEYDKVCDMFQNTEFSPDMVNYVDHTITEFQPANLNSTDELPF